MVGVRKIGHAETYNKNQIKRNLIWFLFFYIQHGKGCCL